VHVVTEPVKLITSVRQAAAACNVSHLMVYEWIRRGLLPEPPWTPQQLQAIRDKAGGGRRSEAAHGSTARWNGGTMAAAATYVDEATVTLHGPANERRRRNGYPSGSGSSSWMRSTPADRSGRCFVI